jgi:molybdopterin molybdotransferase
LAQEVQDQLSQSHVLILTGGVSAGSADYVPAILRELGVTQVFHKVSQKPGKPLWFGVGPLGQLVFGLPGNPVSCMVTALKYVIPALRFLQFGKLPGSNMVPLLPGQQAPSHSHLTLFASVQLTPTEEGALAAHILPQNNSGDFVSLLKSDGVVEIPPGRPNSDGFSYMSWLKNSSLF